MIVIATNNGEHLLPKLLFSLESHGTSGHRVLIVDTGTDQEGSLRSLNNVDRDRYTLTSTPFRGYDTGAYIWAYQNFPDESYLFMHDSIEVLRHDWLSSFEEQTKEVCGYSSFGMTFDSEAQRDRLVALGVFNPSTKLGFSGPVFFATRKALLLADSKFSLHRCIPGTKVDQMGMERGWPMIFDGCGIDYAFLGGQRTFLNETPTYDGKFLMRKTKPYRM